MQHFQPIDTSARKPKYILMFTLFTQLMTHDTVGMKNQDLAIDISKFVCHEEENLIN